MVKVKALESSWSSIINPEKEAPKTRAGIYLGTPH
jgi:hypothetical protein